MSPLSQLTSQPIPPLTPPENWKLVSIAESHEPLVALARLRSASFLLEPAYFKMGIPHAIEEMYVREGVAERLLQACSRLPPGLALLIWDCWRPLEVQQSLFNQQLAVVQRESPELALAEARTRTETYVSLPAADPQHPSPHNTGGAVDLTLASAAGKPLPMGVDFDGFDESARTRILEERHERGERLSSEEAVWLANRRLLFHIMVEAGFTNYWEEWWHFDYGNQFWASVKGRHAIYGPANPDHHTAIAAPTQPSSR